MALGLKHSVVLNADSRDFTASRHFKKRVHNKRMMGHEKVKTSPHFDMVIAVVDDGMHDVGDCQVLACPYVTQQCDGRRGLVCGWGQELGFYIFLSALICASPRIMSCKDNMLPSQW